jgi:hypothetical protein
MFLRNKQAIKSLCIGIGLSAYFWFPAFIEKAYVVGLNIVNFRDHFVAVYELLIPSWGTEFSGTAMSGNKISFQIGLVPIAVAIFAGILLWKEKKKDMKRLGSYFFIIAGLSIVFMFSITKVMWETVTPLQYIQYPWRLLSFVIPASAFFGAYVMSRMKKSTVGVLFAVLAVLSAYAYTRPVEYAPRNESYYLSRSNFMDGTSSMGNSFSTIWTGWKEKRPESEIVIQNGKITKKGIWKYLNKEFEVTMDPDGEIIVNTVYFPGWNVTVDGKSMPIFYQNDGIIRALVPVGMHTIRIQYTDTWPRKIGNIASFVSLLAVIFFLIRYNKASGRLL